MEPLFSEKQLQDMSKENIITLIQAMQVHRKQEIIRTYSKSPIFAKLCLNES